MPLRPIPHHPPTDTDQGVSFVLWLIRQRQFWLAVALLTLAVAVARAADVTADAYALGGSYHLRRQDRDTLSGWNPGAGLGLSYAVAPSCDLTALAITYRDSYRQQATAYGAGVRGILGDRDGLHGCATLAAVCLDGSGHDHAVMALPSLGAGYGPLTVEGTYSPADAVAAVWLRLSWRVAP